MSSHSGSVLDERGRDWTTVYPSDTYGSVTFPAAVPLEAGGCVAHTPIADPIEDPDPDRRAAHCDVGPGRECTDDAARKAHWKLIANAMAVASIWVQPL